jgi:hypothetical protein
MENEVWSLVFMVLILIVVKGCQPSAKEDGFWRGANWSEGTSPIHKAGLWTGRMGDEIHLAKSPVENLTVTISRLSLDWRLNFIGLASHEFSGSSLERRRQSVVRFKQVDSKTVASAPR